MKVFFLLSTLITAIFASEYKAIFNLTTSDKTAVNQSLINSINGLQEHYKAQGDSLKAVVIISGGAYKFFIKDIENSSYKDNKEVLPLQKEFKSKLQALADNGVVFEMCGMGMKKHAIKKEVLYPYVTPVFSRTSSLIHWQSKGYALIQVP